MPSPHPAAVSAPARASCWRCRPGAAGRAQSRFHRRAPLYRHDRGRCRNAAGYARTRRCALGADRRRRKKLRTKPMRRMHRIVLLVGLLAPVLAGCADFDMDKLDIFGLNEKKKLPGERKDVFPEGVPGVTQGVPPEYIKGNRPQADAAQTPEAQPAAQ